MPGGTENTPKRYAKLVAHELFEIAKLHDRKSGRQLADWMGLSEKYIRVRVGISPTASFTVTDVEHFARLAKIDPAEFLGDPTMVRKRESQRIESERASTAGVVDIGSRRRRVGGASEDKAVARKKSRDRGETPADT